MRSFFTTLLIGLAQSAHLEEPSVHTTHGYSAQLAQTQLQAKLATALPGDEPLTFTET